MPEALKPEVAQEIIDWLAIGDFKTPDEFKANFNKKYLTGDDVLKSKPVKDKIGGIVGAINVELKNIFKSYGVELTSAEIEDEDGNGGKVISPKKIAEVAAKKLQEANNKVQEELKGQIGASTDEKIKKLEGQLAILNKDFETAGGQNKELKTKIEEKEKEIETISKTSEGKIKEYVKADKVKQLRDSFPWADEANDFVKEGFWSDINKSVKFDLEEKEGVPYDKLNLVVRNAETGELIGSPTKNGMFLSPDDYLKMQGLEANKKAPVYKINPDGGKKQDGGTGWFKRDPDKKTDPATKPILAVNSSKNLPSTVKSELQ